MNSKKILICSAAFYPEISPRSFRATELARELAQQGHQVSVISYDRSGRTSEYCNHNGVVFRPIKSPFLKQLSFSPRLLSRIMNRMLLMLFEFPDIQFMLSYARALRHESGYDLLISVAVPFPVHWGVALARSAANPIAKVWVADCGDPYMGNQIDSFRKLFYFKYIEKWMFRKTDFITIPIESARPAYYAEFQGKIKIIPQGINFEEAVSWRKPYFPNRVVTFGYAGSFIADNRDPRRLLRLLNSMTVDFRFIIYTNMKSLIQEEAIKSKGRIEIRDYIPREQLIGELSTMDFLTNIENTTTTHSPSKLIDYYLTGRPVLSIDGNSPDENRILQFLKKDYEGALAMEGYNQFNIEVVARTFLNLA